MNFLKNSLMKSIYVLFFASYSKKGMYTTSIKNQRESNKNLVVMIRSTRAQLPKEVP